ncbi:HAD family hydrolase [Paenibacillus germinis]|uniref:HAD family hydrolase n=1 Tax=Paenibacillus germinis TaxID=2654979 RepID=UPI001490D237|nr:HAD family hydrolase [Paenibacillus germinis]
MKINGIFIDFDDTLYDYESCHQYASQKVFSILSQKTGFKEEELLRRYQEAKRSIHVPLHGTASSHNRLLYFQKMIEQFPNQIEFPVTLARICYKQYWDTFIDRIVLFEDVISWLQLLKNQNRKIVMVTDLTADVQFKKIERLRLENLIDLVVTSEESGCEKPHPYIFELALRKSDLSPSQVCMIGDSYDKDILGAINMNIHAFWLNRSGKSRPITDKITEIKEFKEMRGYLK